ncbi:MAG: CerR family C-terminal domain-containing protein [Deltaproteobacteria bacterium]|nr:CerR family C-terminal domain-containing protein [Deltaproteobacteria bacterium]
MRKKNKNEFPKERILNEAEVLFAQKGFHEVTVREITKAAKCNLAAINYHFGNKENLYLEVFRARWVPRARRIREHVGKSLSAQDSPSPQAVIKALAQAFLEGPMSDEERKRHSQLMAREMARPTAAFDLVAEQAMGPLMKELAEVLRPGLPDKMGEDRLMLNMLSVLAMVLYFNFARVAVTRMTGREYDHAFRRRLVEHIVEFSLNGLGVGEKEGDR